MKVFITGATGFIGGGLVRKLVQHGAQVTALVRNPDQAQELDGLGVRLVQGDIREKESMREGMHGADQVFHVAGWYKVGSRDRATAESVNIDGTRNVMELVRELEIPRCVYTSSVVVHSNTHGREVDETYRFEGEHLSIYDETKWRAHYEVVLPMAAAGLPVVIAMPGLVYGPGDTSSVGETLQKYLERRLPVIPRGTEYSWTFIEDVVDGHLLAMEKGRLGESYHLSGPRWELLPVLQLAQQISGVPLPRLIVPGSVLEASIPLMAFLGKIFPLPPTFTAEGLRAVANVTYLGSSAKAEKELGFTARPLEAGLKETLVYMQQMKSS